MSTEANEMKRVVRQLVAADRKRVVLIAALNEGPEFEKTLEEINSLLDELGALVDEMDMEAGGPFPIEESEA